MTQMKKVSPGKIYMGKLAHGADLLEEITNFCIEKNICLARVHAIGAVKKARLGFYCQGSREYKFFDIEKPLEITSLTGNVSIRECSPMVHAHITLSDESGQAYGGHLAPGTIVFACELIIQVFDDAEFKRGFDQETGLPLWDMDAQGNI